MGNNRKLPLGIKLSITIFIMGILISGVMVYFGVEKFYDHTVEQYGSFGDVLINSAGNIVNWDKISYYVETKEEDEEYQEVLANLRQLNESADSSYLYVIVPYEEGAMFIYDTDESEDHCYLGYHWEWYEDFFKHPKEINNREMIGPIVTDEKYGAYLSIYVPFNDSNGEFVGYIGVDYLVDHILEQTETFRKDLIIIGFAVSTAMTLLFMLVFHHSVTKPINKMVAAANDYVLPDVEDADPDNSITRLSIHTNDELEGLSYALKSMEKNIRRNLVNLAITTHKAETDILTNLYNRGAFIAGVNKYLLENNGENYVFSIFDIDRFKSINDNYGHMKGDLIIEEFAYVLKSHFRDGDLVARLGGDEFGVFSRGKWSKEEIIKRFERLLEDISLIEVGEGNYVTASIGIIISSKKETSYQEFYVEADSALYETKKNGRNGYTVKEL